MKIIAIETSHDDTSLVLYQDKKILSDFSYSQTKFHQKFGGTIPEYASRHHFVKLLEILPKLLKQDLTDLDHVAYTKKPGLIGSLHMGALFAKALAFALGVKAKPINHMHGHIFAVAFTEEITYPALALIASGGHTQLWNVKNVNSLELISQTKDDAAGEVYDKVARALKLGFPGGPLIDKLYNKGKVDGSLKLKAQPDLNFSFSGLKTKTINYIHNQKQKNKPLDQEYIASNFQHSIVTYLIAKTQIAIKKLKPQAIILGGGVSANSLLRQEFAKLHRRPLIPAMAYTTDNAQMIAICSHLKELND